MSAWRLGYGPFIRALGAPSNKFAAFIDKLIPWIPGDTMAIYVPGVTLIASQSTSSHSMTFLIVMLVVNVLIIVAGAFAAGSPFDKRFFAKLVLGFFAFTIWTLTVPDSGWQAWSFVADNPGWVAVTAAILGLLFGLLAEGILKRIRP